MFGDTITITAEIKTIQDLIEHITLHNKDMARFHDSLIFSINHKNASLKSIIKNGDVVSIFLTPTGG